MIVSDKFLLFLSLFLLVPKVLYHVYVLNSSYNQCNHLFIQYYKKLFVIVLRFFSKAVPNVSDVDENSVTTTTITGTITIMMILTY